ncbi:unnamed protein product [Allacma fusca]|uniref:Uncharacterized protein n=1 Tax=Allacma fusca TaxID=39272 RepID=A0A8J2KCU1_9HEXA|nr:unnamed protein product [Allacma fusca]
MEFFLQLEKFQTVQTQSKLPESRSYNYFWFHELRTRRSLRLLKPLSLSLTSRSIHVLENTNFTEVIMSQCGTKNPFVPMATDTPTKSNTKNIWGDEYSGKPSEHVPVWNIPAAIPKRFLTPAEIDFEHKKKLLAHRLPMLTPEDISRERFPYHVILLNELHESGYPDVAKEMKSLLRRQEFSQGGNFTAPASNDMLETKKELLDAIADALKYCSDVVQKKQISIAINVRKTMAEHMIKIDLVWIAKHFYRTCLDLTTELPKESCAQFRSEIKCILGYLEIDNVEKSDWCTKVAIGLLEESRELSKGQTWIFHSKILVLKLRKPINLYGLRSDFLIINGHSMTIHSVATLMLNEVLQARAGSIVFSTAKEFQTEFYMEKALNYAQRAMILAGEIHEPTAEISARMTLGAIFLKKKEFYAALTHLEEFQKSASLHCDHEAEAISFNMIGCCYVGLENAENAVESFVCQKEIADMHNFPDLSVDALQNIGQVLLQEGLLLEAELCFAEAFHGFKNLDVPRNVNTENCWVKTGISAGLNLWTKFAGHCRRNQVRDYENILNWKSHRAQPRRISKVPMEILQLDDVFSNYDPVTKIPRHNVESLGNFVDKAKKHLVIGPDSLVDLQDAFRVEVEAQKRNDRRIKTAKPKTLTVRIRGPPTSSSSYLSSRHSSTTMTGTETGYLTNVSDLDENRFIIFESDLRSTIKKRGGTYDDGGSRWTIASTRTIKGSDPNDPTKTKTHSVALIPTFRSKLSTYTQEDELAFQALELTDTALKMVAGSDDDLILVEVSATKGVVAAKKKSEFERPSKSMKTFGHNSSNDFMQKSKAFLSTKTNAMTTAFMSRADVAKQKLKLSNDTRSNAPSLWAPSRLQMNRLSSSTEKMISRVALHTFREDVPTDEDDK